MHQNVLKKADGQFRNMAEVVHTGLVARYDYRFGSEVHTREEYDLEMRVVRPAYIPFRY
jgi:hypothetical protein